MNKLSKWINKHKKNENCDSLKWKFYYETNENTQPYQLSYYAKFEDSPCEPLYSEFPN